MKRLNDLVFNPTGVVNDSAAPLGEIAQAANNRFAIEDRGIVENYIHSDLGIVIDFNFLDPAELSDIHYSITSGNNLANGEDIHIAVADLDVFNAKHPNGRNHGVMLVEVIELSDRVDVVGRVLPVRIKPYNKVNKFRGRTGKFPGITIVKGGLIFIDWETITVPRFIAVNSNSKRREMIERAAQVMDHVANDSGGFDRDAFLKVCADYPVHILRIFIEGNTVWIAADKNLKDVFEITNMAVCSGDF